ncbi:hypothetical protein LOAG_15458 [Loa loa]|uniref:Uncharacterized protein n=1 Tax=Loa loa TaxID=7209 RepID=A0A1S0TG38_LOALO|nr:hypothetical protein LOAG_15458 [Loa loa]EFO13073.1 hypothetical protein LOAG_15458 [Loa loa]
MQQRYEARSLLIEEKIKRLKLFSIKKRRSKIRGNSRWGYKYSKTELSHLAPQGKRIASDERP